ncbi:MAG TPA: hypothetical protein VG845_12735 [Dehalococcoidia bacterium]|jgi:hypothetical protein|nr:hypothetical protein [Dehalococcoidia bacterium]
MARYLVQANHSPDECLQGLDDILAQGAQALAGYDFGCAVGDHSNHVCFCSAEADSEAAVREMLPRGIRARAQITEVGKFTAEQVQSFHAA